MLATDAAVVAVANGEHDVLADMELPGLEIGHLARPGVRLPVSVECDFLQLHGFPPVVVKLFLNFLKRIVSGIERLFRATSGKPCG